jgi:hypothetical protein
LCQIVCVAPQLCDKHVDASHSLISIITINRHDGKVAALVGKFCSISDTFSNAGVARSMQKFSAGLCGLFYRASL